MFLYFDYFLLLNNSLKINGTPTTFSKKRIRALKLSVVCNKAELIFNYLYILRLGHASATKMAQLKTPGFLVAVVMSIFFLRLLSILQTLKVMS